MINGTSPNGKTKCQNKKEEFKQVIIIFAVTMVVGNI
jgi:hypothetical protein